jgi:hypothetical protein
MSRCVRGAGTGAAALVVKLVAVYTKHLVHHAYQHSIAWHGSAQHGVLQLLCTMVAMQFVVVQCE